MPKTKQVEWVNTNNKPYYLSYDMPISINNRCWFFWANTVKGWRKILNLANTMAFGCKISVVLLYGEIKQDTIKKYIQSLNNEQLIVLHADYITADEIEVATKAEEWLKSLQSGGYRAKDENKEWVFDVSETFKKYQLCYDESKQKYNEFLSGKATIAKIKKTVGTNGYTVLANVKQKHVSGKQQDIVSDLLNIAKELYPLGIEAATESEFAYKRVAVPKMIKLGLVGETDDALIKNCGVRLRKEKGLIQFSFFDDYSTWATQIVVLIRETFKQNIEHLGYSNSAQLCQVLVNRPYGVYECNYYYYIIAFALSEFTKGYYHCWFNFDHSSVSIWQRTDDVEFNKHTLFLPMIFTQTEKQKSLAKKIARLFDISGEPTLQQSIKGAIEWIIDNIHFDSIDRVSHELFALINEEAPLYSREVEKYDDWLDKKTFNEIYDKLRTVDDDFFKRLTEKCGEKKATLYKRRGYTKGCCGGWLWTIKFIDEHLEGYMSKILCRECGRVLNPLGDRNCREVSHYEDGKYETHDFTLKEIEGLNKKFFGRFQTDYFCIHCMAEILETTEWELYKKMHEFKESGCTLFG